MTWGSERIECIRPENEVSTLFYATSNQMEVAFSLAEGSDPQYNTSEVYLYEAIEKSTIVFEVSFSTVRETVPHVSKCQALGPPSSEYPDGTPLASRYEQLVPDADYGPGYLMLSIEDVLAAAGRNMADIGSEAAPLRLSGLEIVARVNVRNYQVPYSWPFASWNPWQLRDASHIDCTVHFDVLRDQFKVVHLGEERHTVTLIWNERADTHTKCNRPYVYVHMYIHTYRQTGRQTGTQTDRHTDRQTYRQTYRHTCIHAYVYIDIYVNK